MGTTERRRDDAIVVQVCMRLLVESTIEVSTLAFICVDRLILNKCFEQ